MSDFLWSWLMHTWAVTLEAAPWLMAGFLFAGLVHAWVPVRQIAAHLGGPNLGGVLKAAFLGVPLPLCSCSVIPLASSIRRSGASRGATASFLISTPETGVDSISITYALLGPVMAVLRPLAALLSAITAGLLINRLGVRPSHTPEAKEWNRPRNPDVRVGDLAEDSQPAGCGDCSCKTVSWPTQAPPRPPAARLKAALRYGFVEMFADLSVWLLVGFVLAGLISAVVPQRFLENYLGSGLPAMLAALAVALPFYVCATSSTPIAAALMSKGLSPGTALVFLLVGPATNIATMVVVAKELGRRSLLIYLLSIAVVAVVIGIAVDLALIMPALEVLRVSVSLSRTASWPAILAAVVFVVLVLNGLRLRYGLPPRKQVRAS